MSTARYNSCCSMLESTPGAKEAAARRTPPTIAAVPPVRTSVVLDMFSSALYRKTRDRYSTTTLNPLIVDLPLRSVRGTERVTTPVVFFLLVQSAPEDRRGHRRRVRYRRRHRRTLRPPGCAGRYCRPQRVC